MFNRKAYSAARKKQLKAAGKCPSCGKINDTPDFFTCSVCRKKATKRARRAVRERRAAGLCLACGKNPLESKSRCGPCLAVARNAHRQRKVKVFEYYGGVCRCCKEGELDFLHIDHIAGGGRKERREKHISDALATYLHRTGFPPGYQILCANCNQGKQFNGGFCPHHPEVDLRIPNQNS